MSESHEEKNFTKEQAIAVLGTLATSGVLDFATHGSLPVMLGGAVAVFAAGKLTPEIMKLLIPGSDPEATRAATNAVVNRLAPEPPQQNELPQDAVSKLKRLVRIKAAEPDQAEPKEARDDERPRPQEQAGKGQQSPPTALPPVFKLDDVLETVAAANSDWRLYFGETTEGPVTISIDEMYHVIDASSSGKGKSNRFRLAMMQLVETCEVYYINPLAATVKSVRDDRKVEVWAPIFDRLANGKPAKTKEDIDAMMTALVDLIQDRSQQEQAGDFSWQEQPVFLFVDELPEVYALSPKAIEKLDKVGRMGRQFSVFTYAASQTAQVSDIGQSTAAQANYKTRIYGGGDATSSMRLMKQKVSSEYELTLASDKAGLTLMLAAGLRGLQFVRAPLVTNEALFAYFGLTFNLNDWLPSRGASSGSRRGRALDLSRTSTEEKPARPARRSISDDEQGRSPVNQTAAQTKLEAITRLFQEDKIDLETFVRVLDTIHITESDVSRPVPSPTSTVPQMSLESPTLRLVGNGDGNFPAHEGSPIHEREKPVPTFPDAVPNLGTEDKAFTTAQAQDFLRRYRKTPDIKRCLGQMTNNRGEIGMGSRYYKHAKWFAEQQKMHYAEGEE